MADPSLRRLAVRILQYGLSVAAFGWLLGQVRLDLVGSLVGRLSGTTIGGLILVSVVGVLARFAMWCTLMPRERGIRLVDIGMSDLAIKFVNQLLPSRVSGVSVSPVALRYFTGIAWTDAVGIAGVHTVVYSVLYATVAAAGLVIVVPHVTPVVSAVLAGSILLYVVAGGTLLSVGIRPGLSEAIAATVARTLGALPVIGDTRPDLRRRLPEFTADATERFRTTVRSPSRMGLFTGSWVVAVALVPAIRFALLFSALSVDFQPLVVLPAVIVVAYSVTLLPLTPGGAGVTEISATLVFVALGVSNDVIVTVVVFDRFLGVYLPALLGWYPVARSDLTALLD